MTIPEAIAKISKAGEAAKRTGTLVLETEARKAVKLNFIEQGRPAKWKPKEHPDGRAILTGRTGNGQRSINVQSNTEAGEVLIGSNLIYMQAHQGGAVIQHKARTYKYRKTRSGKYQFAGKNHKVSKQVTGKAYTVNLPSRPWAVWTREDTKRAEPVIVKAIEMSFN